MDITIKSVFRIHTLLHFLVFVGKLLRLFDHLFDLLLGQTALIICNRDLLTFTSTLVLCSHIQNTVGIDLESNLNLRLSTGGRRDSPKFEFAKEVVVLSHWSLTFENLNVYRWLVILIRGEDLRLFCWDNSVSTDKLRHDTTHGLNAQSQRSHIQK